MPLLEFRFVLSRRDVLTGIRIMQAQSLGFRAAMTVIGVGLVVTWGLAVLTRDAAVQTLALAFAVLGLFLMVYQLLIVPWTLTGELGLNDHVRGESTWQVDQDGIAIRTLQKQTFLPWSSFARVLQTSAHYLFVYVDDRHQFQIVPRRALRPDQVRMFEGLIAQQLPQPVPSQVLMS